MAPTSDRVAAPAVPSRSRGLAARLVFAGAYAARLLLVGLLVGSVFLVGGLTQMGLNNYLHPPSGPPDRTPAAVGLAYRDAGLLTEDGLRLAAWFVPGTRPEALIMVHGIGTNRSVLLELASDLHSRGYNLLLLDLRAHGSSEGDTSTLGVKEVRDIGAAAAYLRTQPEIDPARMGIYGGSLGGAVALLSAGAMPELRAVVADSSFASARWVVDHQLQAVLNLPDWFGPLLITVGSLEAGISVDDAAPAVAAAHLGKRPLLVIHGTQDGTFDVENARMIYTAASGPRDLWILDGVGHTGAYGHDHSAFIDRLDAFFTAGLA
jgi:dipeptidyl aminopeptidase/acylaminoacyl peptidase